MTRHPLLLAVFTTDLLAFLLMLGASAIAFQMTLHWNPQDTGARQLRLQTRSEITALAVAWAFGLHLFATMALVYAMTNILPGMVPGAMCGTGVLQAMHSGGPRMLIYRLIGLTILWIWWRLEKVNRSLPEAPLVPVNARIVLLALPVFGLALHASWQATQAMDFQQAVDCCAVIYDQFDTLREARQTLGIGAGVWLTAFGALTVAMTSVALATWKTPSRRRANLLLAALAMLWLPIAAVTLVRVFTAYHYGVLHHHCPWCLFLPEHHLAGFPLWASWMLVAMEAVAALVLSSLAVRQPPPVWRKACEQAGQAARNTLLAALLFSLLSDRTGPVVASALRPVAHRLTPRQLFRGKQASATEQEPDFLSDKPGVGRKLCLITLSTVFFLAISDPFNIQNTSANHLLFDEGHSLAGCCKTSQMGLR